jgi:hypothetical protein
MIEPHIEEAIVLMNDFARRTGLDSDRQQQRYLWTDAFAVCNFLGLGRATGDRRYTDLALRLVELVHHTLGRYRHDDSRHGWINGLSDREGKIHPTRGGLRIGKVLPERGADDTFDERLEWERDGQYFHYLSKWMHALDQVSRSTGEPQFNTWARELAASAYAAFTYLPAASHIPRMYWKMSTDLSRPLVSSMGQHDPLDGYVTVLQLCATTALLPQSAGGPDLEVASHRFLVMTERSEMVSPDPLGIGGLLVDTYRMLQLMGQGAKIDTRLVERLLTSAFAGLKYYAQSDQLRAETEYRLAFRELGLAIGLHALEGMRRGFEQRRIVAKPAIRAQVKALMPYVPFSEEIESFWRRPEHQQGSTWSEHQDINQVMLATTLLPDGFLTLELVK